MVNGNDGSLEVKEDASSPQADLVIFVATLPDKFNRQTPCLNELEKFNCSDIYSDIVILHPYYDFNSDIGKKTLSMLGDIVPIYDNAWENTMRKDMFCIKHADFIIFDLDTPDIIHYLTMATCYNKPIIAVSSTLLSIPVYFSGSVSCIVKPKQLNNILKIALEDAEFLSTPKLIKIGKKKDAESNQKSITNNSDGDSDPKI